MGLIFMKKSYPKTNRILLSILLMISIGIGSLVAFHSYREYLDELIYQERLNQMTEVTKELYSSMDLLMSNEWGTAQLIRDGVIDEHLETVEQLTQYLTSLQKIYQAGANKIIPIAIDGSGRYYSASGKKGVIYNVEELVDCEERICSVTNIFGTDATDILFLYKLKEQILLQDTAIQYCGFIKDFSVIISRYHTDAFSGQSILYVMNGSGTKLYSTDFENQNPVFIGRNIYSILEDMTYTHGNSYESFMQRMEENGNSITNATLNETEYYLCLHRMADTDWVMLLAIPAQYVATNTQILVDSVVKTLLLAGFVLVVVFVIILIISMRMQQKEQLYRKEQENSAKLELSRQEAERSKHAAEEAFKVAEAANNSKSSFLSNMSHDIRTPMNAIVGFSELLERDANDPEKVREYTQKIKSSGQHLLGLINDVLDMSKIESGKTTLNLSDEKITDIVNEVETIIRPQMQEKGQMFEVITRDIQHENIVVDKLRLNQILLNLLSNACKYTPGEGHIVFSVTELMQRSPQFVNLRFVVSDNGYGMTKEYAKTIFNAFSREENSVTNKVQGTGLGMAITKNLVKLMGGQISLQTQKGKGSTFTVDLELQLSNESNEILHSHKKAEDTEEFNILNGLHFLAAEDNELNAEILEEMLKTVGATVDVYENGQRIVRAFEKSSPGQYTAILMDVQMPVMNGLEATKMIRTSDHPLAVTIPIIAMTANAFSEDIHDCLEAGMNAHIPKPIDMTNFEQTIRKVCK